MGTFIDFLDKHIWVPILFGILAVGLIGLVVYCLIRRRRQSQCNDYSLIHDDIVRPIKTQLEKKESGEEIRDYALLNCSFYMRSNGKYSLVNHLPEIGSRLSKQWFQVSRPGGQLYLLTMMKRSPQLGVTFTKSTKSSLVQLADTLTHPCLYPLSDLDFVTSQDLVVCVEPYNAAGSLKDVIYQSTCTDPWQTKYCFKSRGLPLTTVQTYGRQILEVLLFLERHNLPSFTQLHSGNVMVTNNICRVTGYWSTLLGYPSKLHATIKKILRTNPDAVHQISFGHLLFEMAAGYELDSATPMEHHLQTVHIIPVRQTLSFIFGHGSGVVPSLAQIADLDFFKSVNVPQQLMVTQQLSFPANVQNILRQIKRKNKTTKRGSKSEIQVAGSPWVSSPLLPASSLGGEGSKQTQPGPSTYGTYGTTVTSHTLVTKVPPNATSDATLPQRNIPPTKTFNGQSQPRAVTKATAKPPPPAKPKPALLKPKPVVKSTNQSVQNNPQNVAKPKVVEKPTTERSALLGDIRKGVKLKSSKIDPQA